tara:strand:+ start:102 stop:374 length:273 start_codon:yes stop_codon:yes gene_type:complete
MAKVEKAKQIGTGLAVGAAIVGGIIAYRNRKKISKAAKKSTNNAKISLYNKKENALHWKDRKVWDAWQKVEDFGNTRKLKSTSVRDIAWG